MNIEIKDGTEIIVKILEWDENWEFDRPIVALSPVFRYSSEASAEQIAEDIGIDGCVDGVIKDHNLEKEFSWRGWSLKNLNKVYSQARKGKKFPKKNYKATEYLLRFFFDEQDQEIQFTMYERLAVKEVKQPTPEDAKRCLEIRKRTKRGMYASDDENEFCGEMLKKYPEWYRETNKEVFNGTVPFGSLAKQE